ncbi:6-phosphogluconolactonase [Pseudomonas sp. TTU2014-080ASC]|uniref:6-phosphogluconolactonase n=1 Tax=Pseudomonas sp. TTU2014-080ASC TaxID=1729724 RepID=UPI00071894DB|nr:6-phosphogluconolactonase [Pseudomonas sp. TTU2014-080ASC]KRW61869.1 6-phosphogluconolactonase [Pseudomonas sp. TTU2014-080ASC]
MAITDLKFPEHVQVHSFPNAEKQAQQLAVQVAEVLQGAIAEQGIASLVVSGGKSPLSFFNHLSQQPLDWSRVVVSLADERWVPVAHADSNEGLVRSHLLKGEAAKARFIGLYHAADSVERAAIQAETALAALPQPISVLVLGMGEDGHTASLFPDSVNLQQALSATGAMRCLPMLAPSVPRQRLTLTYAVLGRACSTFLLLQGKSKVDTLRQALADTDAARMPVRAILSSPCDLYWCP